MCWFDYQRLDANQRIDILADDYVAAYRYVYARREDVTAAASVKPLGNYPDGKQTRTWLMKARDAIDRLNIPYHLYCLFVLSEADRRAWQNLPRINQIYSSKAQEWALLGWELYQQKHVLLPKQTPINRQDYLIYLQSLSNKRNDPKYLLQHLFKHSAISPEEASLIFSHQVVNDALLLQRYAG